MSAGRRLVPSFAAIGAAVVVAWIAAFWFSGPSLDMLLLLRHAIDGDRHAIPDSPVAIIAVDDATLARQDLRNIPIALWGPELAVALDAVRSANPRAIGFDIVLGTTAEAVAPGRDQGLIHALREAAASGKLVLADAQVAGRSFEPHPIFAFSVGGARNIHPVNVIPDRDGVIRSMRLTFDPAGAAVGTPPISGMALELARRADPDVPVAGSEILLNFADRAPAPIYSLGEVLDCATSDGAGALKSAFANRVVLIGSSIDIEDRKIVSGRMFLDPNLGATHLACGQGQPEGGSGARTTVPGILVHAQAINDLLRRDILRPATPIAATLSLLLVAVLGCMSASWLDARRGSVLAFAAALAWTAASAQAIRADLVLPWVGGLVSAGAGYVFMLGYRSLVIDRERKRSVLALSRYLDPSVARSLLAGPRPPELGGELREVTIWFSDIANFSSTAEKLAPHELVARLNEHFAMIAEHVEGEGGIIDKFVGDAVVAIFGAPIHQADHAARAVRAARNVVRAMRSATHGRGAFSVRIGINTGEALVGNIGTRRRFDYTAIGDAVNVAQRIEQANKELGTVVLVTRATALAAGPAAGLVLRGSVTVKGRSSPVEVWTLGEERASSDADSLSREEAAAAAN